MPFDPKTAQAFNPSTAAPAQAAPAAAPAPQASQPAPAPQPSPAAGTDPSSIIGDVGSMVYAALHGAADTATFGGADKASALLAHVISPMTGKPMSYDEAYAKVKSNTARNANENPASAITGDVAGALVGGSALARGAGAVAKFIPGAARVGQALEATAGQPFRNVAKAAAVSGAASGGYTAADELARDGTINPDSVATNTAVGAVVGPAVSKIGTALVKGVQSASTKAVSLLASKIGETPDTLQRVYDNFQAATGRLPTMAEIVGMKSQGELKALAANNSTVQSAINDAADTAANQRTSTLAQTVEDNSGGPAQDINQLTQARRARMDQAMDPIRNTSVGVDHTDVGLLADPRVRAVVRADPNLSQRVQTAIQEVSDHGQSDSLTVNDIDSIRKSIRGRQSAYANPANSLHNPHIAGQFGNLADNIGDLGSAAEPGYADALSQYEQDSNYIKGFKHGSAGKTIGEASDPDLINSLNEAEGQAGHQAGIASRTAEAAASSPQGAVRTANQLAEGAGDSAALRGAVGQKRFQNIQSAAAHESRGAAALDNISGNVKPDAESFSGRQVAQTVGAAASHSTSGILFHAARAIPSFSKLSQPVQQQVARYLANPNMTQQGINLLRRAGANEAQLKKFAVALSANAGLNTADTLGQ